MTIEERNEVLRSRLSMALKQGFVLKDHHYMARDRNTGEIFGYETIIFDHDFAKAIWGEDPICPYGPQEGATITEISLEPGEQETEREFTYTKDHLVKDFLLNPNMFVPMFQHHMQQMVIATDRLEYLRDNTNG